MIQARKYVATKGTFLNFTRITECDWKGGRHPIWIRHFDPNRSTTMMMSKSMLKSVVSATVLAAALVPTAAFASPIHINPSVHAFFGNKQKMVHFSLSNKSGTPLDLKVGEQPITIAVGQTVKLNLAAGTRITTVTPTAKREAGYVVCEVTSAIADATVTLN